MRDSTHASQEASESWFSAIMACLAFGSCFKRESHDDDGKRSPMIVYSQPRFHPAPVGVSESEYHFVGWKQQKGTRKSLGPGSGRISFIGRSQYWSDHSSRRPLVSAPSGFRHVRSESFPFESNTDSSSTQSLAKADGQNPDGFVARKDHARPLELSIYLPDQRISPILPYFEFPKVATPPAAAACCDERSQQIHRLSRQRSYTSMSVHIPRRRLDGGASTSRDEAPPPRIPAKSNYRDSRPTSAGVDLIKERIAIALIEIDHLQKQIDGVIKRQSICVSGPATMPNSTSQTVLEPMPSIPALPPGAPSFAQRLNAEPERPQTWTVKAPSRADRQRLSQGYMSEASKSRFCQTRDDGPLLPPLPLVFRPPLRKKMSFSSVSTWLFPGQEPFKMANFETITNTPKPVRGKDGFYQIASGPRGQHSYESLDSISTWHSEDEGQTAPSTWSPGSTATGERTEQALECTATFGRHDAQLGEPFFFGVAM